MPAGYRQNLVNWCETSFPDSYSEAQLGLYGCIVREVQDALRGLPANFRNAVSNLVSSTPQYNDASAASMYLQLLTGFGGFAFSLADKIRDGFMNAYDSAAAPCRPASFIGWLAATPLAVASDVIQANMILFGACEDRSLMGEQDKTIDGYFWLMSWRRHGRGVGTPLVTTAKTSWVARNPAVSVRPTWTHQTSERRRSAEDLRTL